MHKNLACLCSFSTMAIGTSLHNSQPSSESNICRLQVTYRLVKRMFADTSTIGQLDEQFSSRDKFGQICCVPRVVLTKGVFQSYYTEVPKSPNGFVYYIQATKKFSCKFVGFMRDVKNELLSFNDLSKATNSYQPFGFMCFKAGFS